MSIITKIVQFFRTLVTPLKTEPKEKWLMVRTYKVGVTITRSPEHDRIGEQGYAYAYLFESESGRRRVEFGCSLNGFDAESSFKRLNDWAEYVYPWLHGRYLPGTPTYAEAEQMDVAAKLGDYS